MAMTTTGITAENWISKVIQKQTNRSLRKIEIENPCSPVLLLYCPRIGGLNSKIIIEPFTS
jgi:hypothetical protein